MQELIEALEKDDTFESMVTRTQIAPVAQLDLTDADVAQELRNKVRFSVDCGGFARFLNSLGQIGLSKLAKYRLEESL